MGREYLDCLLIHWPIPEYLDATWECMEKLRGEGLVKKIGVCNVRMRQLKQFAQWKMRPQVIQIERHPLRICPEEVRFCHEHEMEVQAYSPLCKMDARIRNSNILIDLAEKYNKNVGQVVMRWHLDTGVIPVFTSTKTSRIREYTDIFDFCLTKEEQQMVSSLNENYKMYLESWSCPGF